MVIKAVPTWLGTTVIKAPALEASLVKVIELIRLGFEFVAVKVRAVSGIAESVTPNVKPRSTLTRFVWLGMAANTGGGGGITVSRKLWLRFVKPSVNLIVTKDVPS